MISSHRTKSVENDIRLDRLGQCIEPHRVEDLADGEVLFKSSRAVCNGDSNDAPASNYLTGATRLLQRTNDASWRRSIIAFGASHIEFKGSLATTRK